MDILDILRQMERNDGYFARAAVTEALARRDEIVPELLRILEAVAEDPQRYAKEPDYMALTYAMFLLARFRETRACPLLVRIFSAPGETAFDLIGETVTEDLCSILASVSGGDLSGMRALIENEQANEYVRSAAMKGLLTLVATGQCTRDEVMEYFASLFGKLERTPGHTWNALASCCTRLGPEEVLEPIQRAFEDELVEPFRDHSLIFCALSKMCGASTPSMYGLNKPSRCALKARAWYVSRCHGSYFMRSGP